MLGGQVASQYWYCMVRSDQAVLKEHAQLSNRAAEAHAATAQVLAAAGVHDWRHRAHPHCRPRFPGASQLVVGLLGMIRARGQGHKPCCMSAGSAWSSAMEGQGLTSVIEAVPSACRCVCALCLIYAGKSGAALATWKSCMMLSSCVLCPDADLDPEPRHPVLSACHNPGLRSV